MLNYTTMFCIIPVFRYIFAIEITISIKNHVNNPSKKRRCDYTFIDFV